jgi:hypothetical protein
MMMGTTGVPGQAVARKGSRANTPCSFSNGASLKCRSGSSASKRRTVVLSTVVVACGETNVARDVVSDDEPLEKWSGERIKTLEGLKGTEENREAISLEATRWWGAMRTRVEVEISQRSRAFQADSRRLAAGIRTRAEGEKVKTFCDASEERFALQTELRTREARKRSARATTRRVGRSISVLR